MSTPKETRLDIGKLSKGGKSNWKERAKQRKADKPWLTKSRAIAFRILDELKAPGKSQVWLAEQLGVSPQQVNKWVKGKENFTIETISKLEVALGTDLMRIPKQYGTTLQKQAKPDRLNYFSSGKSIQKESEYSSLRLVKSYKKSA
ncbi:MAG TPA: hypothetical protein DEQ34_11130 [Balneolaceae bacterium]|nr:hypothetical protein [Balneolaceae bacterium]|tara:strand:- start:58015 stop:58452 length:438 start_codon:yes stop_codon:yes gene_type:complete